MIAAQRVRNPGLLDLLRRWVEDKYKLPWTHEAIQQYTLLDLMVMFWEDYYKENPLEAKRLPSGEVMFNTGDPLIDKWEREIAMGIEPDLTEGLSHEAREKEKAAWDRLNKRAETFKKPEFVEGGFSETYQ